MKINKKIAIVTGGASGMGADVAVHLSNLGATVLVLDINKHLPTGVNGKAYACDVSNAASVEAVFKDILEEFQSISICIQCAGIAPAAKVIGKQGVMPLADFEKVISVNLVGTFNVMRLALAAMQKNEPETADAERGVVINTASIAAYEGQIGQTAYSASKGGIVSLTLPAAREMAAWGIRVNAIAPGLVATPMLLGMPQAVQESLCASVPYPSRLGAAEEFSLLCRQIIENPYINGTVIRLDGALRMSPK